MRFSFFSLCLLEKCTSIRLFTGLFFVSCRLWHRTAFRRVGELMEELEHLGRPWVLEGKNLRHRLNTAPTIATIATIARTTQPLPLLRGAKLLRSTESLRQVEFARQTIKATVAERQKVTELLKDGEKRRQTENLKEVPVCFAWQCCLAETSVNLS